jgi:hypothetical protein
MATFITPFSFHLLVSSERQSMFASLGQILASVQPLIGSRPAICDVKFPCLFENEILWQFSLKIGFRHLTLEDGHFVITPAFLSRESQTRFQLIDHAERFRLNGTCIFPLFQFFPPS